MNLLFYKGYTMVHLLHFTISVPFFSNVHYRCYALYCFISPPTSLQGLKSKIHMWPFSQKIVRVKSVVSYDVTIQERLILHLRFFVKRTIDFDTCYGILLMKVT